MHLTKYVSDTSFLKGDWSRGRRTDGSPKSRGNWTTVFDVTAGTNLEIQDFPPVYQMRV